MKITTRNLVITGVMVAMSLIWAQFPVSGSIGFDAMPAFFAAAAVSPVVGGVVGIIAHLLIAMVAGFPSSLPVHLVISVTMFLSCFVYGVLRKRTNRYVAVLGGIVMNGPVALFIAASFGKVMGITPSILAMFLGLLPILLPAAAVNVILADILYDIIGGHIGVMHKREHL